MPVEITIPSPGESITEVVIGPWHKAEGDWVEKDETLVEIESDKVTLEVPSPESGVLSIGASEGEEKQVGDVIGAIDPSAKSDSQPAPSGAAPAAAASAARQQPAPEAKPEPAPKLAAARNEAATAIAAESAQRITSVAKKIAEERGVNLAHVRGTGPAGRITKQDVLTATPAMSPERAPAIRAEPREIITTHDGHRGVRREKMTRLRQRIAQRLVEAKQTTAMLTTFNECDMTAVMDLRARHKDAFAEKHGVGLGFMSFFAKAAVSALQAYPRVNAYIVGDEIEYHDFVDLSIAVGTERGLIVPVLRNVERMSYADIERGIKDLATRGRAGKLSLEEMTGGTFTITNGGVYGSLMATPILNPPQSGILGMHKIMKRAVEDPANPGQIALRPMMYIALSYDHRMVDGEESIGFLIHIKNCIENPERLLLGL